MTSIFGDFGYDNPIPPIPKLIQKLGFDDATEFMADRIMECFKNNNMGRDHIRQFLREEADAASKGDAMARQFANSLFNDPNEYKGAMAENSPYPIDGPGGPKQMIILMFMQLKDNLPLMVKFRCAVVGEIKRRYDNLV